MQGREAFDLLNSTSSQTSQSLVPGFIDDPEPSLRREGVELLIEQAAELKNQAQSIEAYEYALSKAREVDQIEKVCKSLKSLGKTIDIQKLMGFIINWEITGPFQNKERKGFAVAYPPEIPTETYPSKDLTWQTISTSDPFGLIDLNQHLGFVKEVLCYARADFDSPVAQKVHFRIGSKNAWKLWVNDKMIFARDEYHRGGTRVDQFVLAGNLIKGSNRILVKVCQNEQTQSWTKQWEFCFRITDPTGKPIQSTSNLATCLIRNEKLLSICLIAIPLFFVNADWTSFRGSSGNGSSEYNTPGKIKIESNVVGA